MRHQRLDDTRVCEHRLFARLDLGCVLADDEVEAFDAAAVERRAVAARGPRAAGEALRDRVEVDHEPLPFSSASRSSVPAEARRTRRPT